MAVKITKIRLQKIQRKNIAENAKEKAEKKTTNSDK
jgi:hypothetical protein